MFLHAISNLALRSRLRIISRHWGAALKFLTSFTKRWAFLRDKEQTWHRLRSSFHVDVHIYYLKVAILRKSHGFAASPTTTWRSRRESIDTGDRRGVECSNETSRDLTETGKKEPSSRYVCTPLNNCDLFAQIIPRFPHPTKVKYNDTAGTSRACVHVMRVSFSPRLNDLDCARLDPCSCIHINRLRYPDAYAKHKMWTCI